MTNTEQLKRILEFVARVEEMVKTLGGNVVECEKIGRKKLAFEVAGFGDGFVVGIADVQFHRQRNRLAGTVGDQNILCRLAQGPGDGAAHVAAADKSVFHSFLLRNKVAMLR